MFLQLLIQVGIKNGSIRYLNVFVQIGVLNLIHYWDFVIYDVKRRFQI